MREMLSSDHMKRNLSTTLLFPTSFIRPLLRQKVIVFDRTFRSSVMGLSSIQSIQCLSSNILGA
jgi:hypothetical protein